MKKPKTERLIIFLSFFILERARVGKKGKGREGEGGREEIERMNE